MKILSNKKYNELILKSCEGMFGAVTDDMLLRENALLNAENEQLKEEIENIKDFNNKLQASKDRLDKDDYNLAHILTELEEWLKEKWYEIEPKGTGINFNCEYDSEEDYVRGMETKSKLDTLKNSLNKIQELKEKYK